MFDYQPGRVGQDLLNDRESFVKIIMGPVGGGKSTVALMDLFRRSVEQKPFMNVRRSRHGILRNTAAQVKGTVKPILDQWFSTMSGGMMGSWKHSEGSGVYTMKFRNVDDTIVHADFMLLAADSADDVSRLLSLELSSGWVEECREINKTVFEGFLARVDRFPPRIMGGVTNAGVVGSTNAPMIGSFWQKNLEHPPSNWGVFMQPPALLAQDPRHPNRPMEALLNPLAENLGNLSPGYYRNLIEGKSEDWLNVYMRNKYGAGNAGMPLYDGVFIRGFHVSSKELLANAASVFPLIVGMDNGLQAAAVIAQRDVRGRVNVLGECYVPDGEKYGVETFLDKDLIPYIRTNFPNFPNHKILFVVDPACFTRSQVDEKTIAKAIENRGFNVIRAPTNVVERRIQAVENMLGIQVDGGAGFLISPKCRYTVQSMEYGHRWKKGREGVSTDDVEKNHYSHIGDAVQYLCLHVDAREVDIKPKPVARKVKRSNYKY